MDLVYGYYNLFNVNASGNSEEIIYTKALEYAIKKGWNSRANAIIGGSEYYKSQYIGKGQNTLYYQRFNVVYERALFTHQYQQDVMGAETSARLLAKYYESTGTLNTVTHVFIIPLYENMPIAKCTRPNPNSQTVAEYNEEKVLVDKLEVRAGPCSNRIISYLNKNETIKVLERAENVSVDGNYWDVIVSKTDGSYGYVLRSGISGVNMYPQYVFDSDYYAENNPDIKAAYGKDKAKLLQHFLEFGLKEGRKASSTFDVKYYLNANQDLKKTFGNNYEAAFKHFVDYGCKEYRKSSDEYDGNFYRLKYSDLANMSSEDLMKHYINFGKAEGRWAGMDYEVEGILFDSDVYAEANLDLKNAFGNNKSKLLEHWYQFGISEGRIASIAYQSEYYVSLNSDLERAFGRNYEELLKHFINSGIKEGRNSSLVFEVSTYFDKNSDLKAAFGTNYKLGYLHFINYGINEGRTASRIFEILTYINLYGDLRQAFGTNYKLGYLHFINNGLMEGRQSSSNFNVINYLNTYPDLNLAFGNDYRKYYIHYLQFGILEGRKGA